MIRDSFVFYRGFAEAIKELDAETKSEFIDALCGYALDGELPECSGTVMAMFKLVKPQIDANNQRYENGKKGGRTKTKSEPNNNQTETKTEPSDNQTETEAEPQAEKAEPNVNVNVNVNDNVNVNVNDNVNDSLSGDKENKTRARTRFSPPSVDQVNEYIAKMGYKHVDAVAFVAFYASKNWMVGKNKMSDWKQAVVSWETRHRKEAERNGNDVRAGDRKRSRVSAADGRGDGEPKDYIKGKFPMAADFFSTQ